MDVKSELLLVEARVAFLVAAGMIRGWLCFSRTNRFGGRKDPFW